MVLLQTEVSVNNVRSKDIYDFMLNCEDIDYQKWWPGVHLAYHTVQRTDSNVGNVVFFDEKVGKWRLKFYSVVVKADSNKEIIWQMKWGKLLLPAWLILSFEEVGGKVTIAHRLKVGYKGLGRILDIVIKPLSLLCEKDLNTHAQTEFPRLAQMLAEKRN